VKSSCVTTYVNSSCCQLPLSLSLSILLSMQLKVHPHYCRYHQRIKCWICIISRCCASGISLGRRPTADNSSLLKLPVSHSGLVCIVTVCSVGNECSLCVQTLLSFVLI
jgi:hypothetical protein